MRVFKILIFALVFATFAVVLMLSVTADAAISDPRAHQGEVAGYADPDWRLGTYKKRPKVFMVGDSITHAGRTSLNRPKWEVSAVPGRDVCTLPYYLRDRMKALKAPKTVVVALGTNACPEWRYEDYRDALRTLPARTQVVLVTTYRDPVRYSDANELYRRRASVQSTYYRWMQTLDRVRPHTCLANWRAEVVRRPWLVHDGVHLGTYGRKVWAATVTNAVARCR
jgi:hypothetical protein